MIENGCIVLLCCLFQAGVVLVLVTLFLSVGYNMASKNLSLDIGGAKRLHALSTSVSAVLLAPWAAFVFYTREVSRISRQWNNPSSLCLDSWFSLEYCKWAARLI